MSSSRTSGGPIPRTGAIVLLCTVPDPESGRTLARRLLRNELAACVNLIPGVTSIYRWEGEVREDDEHLLVIKTDEKRVDAAIGLIERDHPYDCPEAIGLTVTHGSAQYLEWISSSLGNAAG